MNYTDGLFTFLAEKFQRYSNQKNYDVSITLDKLMSFLGILYLSGYHSVPCQDLMGSDDDDIGISAVRNSLSRSDFRKLKQAVHLNDNRKSVNETDTSS